MHGHLWVDRLSDKKLVKYQRLSILKEWRTAKVKTAILKKYKVYDSQVRNWDKRYPYLAIWLNLSAALNKHDLHNYFVCPTQAFLAQT